MANFSRRDVSYSALNNESSPPLRNLIFSTNAAPTLISLEHEHEDSTKVIIHQVPQNKGESFLLNCSRPCYLLLKVNIHKHGNY